MYYEFITENKLLTIKFPSQIYKTDCSKQENSFLTISLQLRYDQRLTIRDENMACQMCYLRLDPKGCQSPGGKMSKCFLSPRNNTRWDKNFFNNLSVQILELGVPVVLKVSRHRQLDAVSAAHHQSWTFFTEFVSVSHLI